MLKLISFGSGSSGNCYCLYTDTEGILIDAGIGIRTLKKYFCQYGLSLSKIHNVLVTHDHADHIKSVGSLSAAYNLCVYSSQNVHAGIDRNYCVKRKVAAALKRYVKVGEPFRVGPFDVTAFHVPHDSTDNVGYVICHDGVTFVLLTDVGHLTDEMRGIISSANYLVIEANHDEDMLWHGRYPEHLKHRITCGTGHLSNLKCGQAIAANASPRLRQVWLCHLSEDNNKPQLAHDTVARVLAEGGIGGFSVDVLSRKSPCGPYELL